MYFQTHQLQRSGFEDLAGLLMATSCFSASRPHPPAGLLLLNRSVYDGAHIMTSPHDLPEQQFPLQAPPQQDALLDLRPLQQQLAACSSSSTSQASAAVLTPGLPQLYELLEQTRRTLPGGNKQQQQLQQQQQPLDVAAVMQQALCEYTPATLLTV
jgi:hypothetical protein